MNTQLEAVLVRLESLEHANTAIQIQNALLVSRIATADRSSRNERRKMRVQAGFAVLALGASFFLSPGNRQAIAQGYGSTLTALNTRLAAVENKTRYVSVDVTAKSTTFSGCNVIVNDGGGATTTVISNAAGDGLGNLIVGYNDFGNGRGDDRRGVHNLIVGDENSYSSYGGLVVGFNNASNSHYASVSGGTGNSAGGQYGSVSGGLGNTTNNDYCSVSGGVGNTANGAWSSISGGYQNTAGGPFASISGGNNITNSIFLGWSAGSLHSP